jgi:hypothetical protein
MGQGGSLPNYSIKAGFSCRLDLIWLTERVDGFNDGKAAQELKDTVELAILRGGWANLPRVEERRANLPESVTPLTRRSSAPVETSDRQDGDSFHLLGASRSAVIPEPGIHSLGRSCWACGYGFRARGIARRKARVNALLARAPK